MAMCKGHIFKISKKWKKYQIHLKVANPKMHVLKTANYVDTESVHTVGMFRTDH